MGNPGLLPGGLSVEGATTNANPSMGVFSDNPGATPKYAINKGQRDAEHRETMARLFIEMGQKERKDFVNSVPAETRALAQVLCGIGSGASGGTGFIDFLLTQAVEPFQEKVQVVETLSDNFVVYLFGQAAPQFQYSGVLLNTYQDDQRVWMMRMYRDILRGTQLARRRKLVRLRYDSVIVSGIFIAHQQALEGVQENSAQFSFGLIPMQYVIFTPNLGAPTQLETPFTPGGKYALGSTAPPDSNRLRTVAPSRPSQPSQKISTDKEPELMTNDNKAKLDKRVDAGPTTPATTPTVRGGTPRPATMKGA